MRRTGKKNEGRKVEGGKPLTCLKVKKNLKGKTEDLWNNFSILFIFNNYYLVLRTF